MANLNNIPSDSGYCEYILLEEDIKQLNTKRRLLYLNTQFVPRTKHFSSLL